MRIEVETSLLDRILWVALALGTFGFVIGST